MIIVHRYVALEELPGAGAKPPDGLRLHHVEGQHDEPATGACGGV